MLVLRNRNAITSTPAMVNHCTAYPVCFCGLWLITTQLASNARGSPGDTRINRGRTRSPNSSANCGASVAASKACTVAGSTPITASSSSV